MEFSQIKSFPLDLVQEMFTKHAEYAAIKNKLLTQTSKKTIGKANVGEDNIESALKWLPFVQDNPEWITKKLDVKEYERTADEARLLLLVEKVEAEDQALSKTIHDAIAPDLRFFWTTAEGYYDEAIAHDSRIKEKYKDLPSISPKRKSDTQVEKDFNKLQARRNKGGKGNGETTT